MPLDLVKILVAGASSTTDADVHGAVDAAFPPATKTEENRVARTWALHLKVRCCDPAAESLKATLYRLTSTLCGNT